MSPAKPASKEGFKEPWRQRLIRSLLYGRNVDRAAKARVRVGFVMLAFAAVYVVIGSRLVMFAIGADAHGARRAASQDVVATARPDIVDRNGEILATDVKASSLFGEPRRIIDKDEAIELLTATVPDLDEAEVRERLSSRKGFVWLKREITAWRSGSTTTGSPISTAQASPPTACSGRSSSPSICASSTRCATSS